MRGSNAHPALTLALVTVCLLANSSDASAQRSSGIVRVSPDWGGEAHALANSTDNALVFRVYNDGARTVSTRLACRASGAAQACRLDQDQTAIPAQAWVHVVVRYSVGTSGKGAVSLAASADKDADSGTYDVLALATPEPTESSRLIVTPMGEVQPSPWVTISPYSGRFTGPVGVEITYCSNYSTLLPATRWMKFDSTDVTSSFRRYDTLAPDSWCTDRGRTVGTVSPPGTLTGYMCEEVQNLNSSFALAEAPNTALATSDYPPGCRSETAGRYVQIGTGTGALSISLAENPQELLEPAACLVTGAGAGAYQCGSFVMTQSMPAFRSMGRDRSVTLLYNSSTAEPRPIIMADLGIPSGIARPDSLQLRLMINDTTYSNWYKASPVWETGGRPHRFAITFDAGAMPTGVYSYVVEVAAYSTLYASSPQLTLSDTGRVVIVNRRASPYGAGWSVAGVDWLKRGPGGRLLVTADGGYAFYTLQSGTTDTWVAPAGGVPDTIRDLPSGNMERRLLNGTVITYNSYGQQVRVVSKPGDAAEYTYNGSTEASGIRTMTVAPLAAGYTYTLGYDGTRLDYVRDPAGRTWQVQIAPSISAPGGLLASLTDPDTLENPPFGESTWSPARQSPGGTINFAYTGSLLTQVTSRRSYSTTITYHPNTSLLARVDEPEFNVWWAFGSPLLKGLSTGPAVEGVDTANVWGTFDTPATGTYSYKVNRFGAPRVIVDPEAWRTEITYSSLHPLAAARVRYANGRVVRMMYDNLGRLTESHDSTHSSGPLHARTRYRYEDANSQTRPSLIISPRQLGVYDTTRLSYNVLGLPDTVTDARRVATTFSYEGSQLSVITEVLRGTGYQTALGYDPISRNLTSVSTPSTPTRPAATTRYEYDAAGRVRVVRAPATAPLRMYPNVLNWTQATSQTATIVNSNFSQELKPLETRFTYDREGHVLTRTSPGNRTRTWTYDNIGRVRQASDGAAADVNTYSAGYLSTQTLRNGITIRNLWPDQLGRPTSREYTGGGLCTACADNTNLAYDAMGNISLLANPTEAVGWEYTPEGAINSEAGAGGTTLYTYHPSGARKSMTRPDGSTVTYSYGPGNLLQTLVHQAGGVTRTVSFEYDEQGRRSSLNLPQGAVQYRYDIFGQLEIAQSGSTTFYSLESTDSAGRPAAFTVLRGGGSQSLGYTYDAIGQVIADGSGQYGYDEDGNRKIQRSVGGDTRYYYDARGRLGTLVGPDGSGTYRYDASGWLTMDSSTARPFKPHSYYGSGKLRSNLLDNSAQYEYDAAGRLITRWTLQGGFRTDLRTEYDGNNPVRLVGTGVNGHIVHTGAVDEPVIWRDQNTDFTCYYVTDGGRLLGMVTAGGGDCTIPAAEGGAIADSHSFELSRQPAEAGSSLSFFRNRWYDANTGRFTQEDPIGFAGGSNLYAYSGNNPAMFTDPFGLDCKGANGESRPCNLGDVLKLTVTIGGQLSAGVMVGGNGVYLESQVGPVVGVEMNGEVATPVSTPFELSGGAGVQLPGGVSGGVRCNLLSSGQPCIAAGSVDGGLTPSSERTIRQSRRGSTKVFVSAILGLELGVNEEALAEVCASCAAVLERIKGENR